ncbi:MAG: carbon monoxide dehydrogenase, partial [Chloroflexota bacterium]
MATREAAQRLNGAYIGAPVKRVNDHKFITGHGQFVDDISLPNTLHVTFVRSPHAHASVGEIDTSAAENHPGVVAVITGDQITDWIAPDGPHDALLPGKELHRYPITNDKARFVGDPVAFVVAETLAQA